MLCDSYVNISQMYNIIAPLISSDMLYDCYLVTWNKV